VVDMANGVFVFSIRYSFEFLYL